jgi:hypothetical protein
MISEEVVAEDGSIPDLRLHDEHVLAFLEVKVSASFTPRQLKTYGQTLCSESGNRRRLYFVLAPEHRRGEFSREFGSWPSGLGPPPRLVTWETLARALHGYAQDPTCEVDKYLAEMSVGFIRQEVTGMHALTETEVRTLEGLDSAGPGGVRELALGRVLALLDATREKARVGKLYFSPNPLGPDPWVSFPVNPGWRLQDSDGEEAEVAVYRMHGGQYRLAFELTEHVVEKLRGHGVYRQMIDRGYRDCDSWLERSLFEIAGRHGTGPLSDQAAELLTFIRVPWPRLQRRPSHKRAPR